MAFYQYRLFFDSSVYITALLSPRGAAGELIRLIEAGGIQMVVSEDVVTETDRVLRLKFPELIQESINLWTHLAPEIALSPTFDQMKPFLKKLATDDAKILCSAQLAKVSAFVTWNTRDFMAQGVASLVDFPIVVPADGLKLLRKWIEPFLD
ncbi:MAG: PIN domain-containing protein [Candidatus Omnitrophica bacterium]|nr:PIN domain-containing protein [Candidatus Omnitrophota bacterium]